MSTAELMGLLLKLQSQVDLKTIVIVGRFFERAMATGDPKSFILEVMGHVVDAEEVPDKVQVVSVKVLPKKAGGR